jgi:hypothetical protein
MKLNFSKLQKGYKKYQDFQNQSYDLMLEKVLNENDCKVHTMLMKSDFENYLILNKEVVYDFMKDETADLFDFERFEKELNKNSGSKKS